jgi:hypothetical protein
MAHTIDPSGAPLCVCGHAKDAHEHYRKGTDCAVCAAGECIAFAPGNPAVPRPVSGDDAIPSAHAPQI